MAEKTVVTAGQSAFGKQLPDPFGGVTAGIVTAWWNTCQYSYFREDMDDDF